MKNTITNKYTTYSDTSNRPCTWVEPGSFGEGWHRYISITKGFNNADIDSLLPDKDEAA